MNNKQTEDEGLTSRDLLEYKWKEYALYISHFRYYLDITLKTNVFFYLTTGGVVGYYLTSGDKGTVKYFFLLPILIGTTLTGMFIYGANLWRKAYINSNAVKTQIEKDLGAKELPDTHLVYLYLWLSAIMFFIIGFSLAILPYFIGGSSKKYLVFAVSLLMLGRFIIPFFARKTDRRLKRERSLSNRTTFSGKFTQWESFIYSEDFVPSALEELVFYDELSPFLGKETHQHIKSGTITSELLLEDIKRIKAAIFTDAAGISPPEGFPNKEQVKNSEQVQNKEIKEHSEALNNNESRDDNSEIGGS
jgi:hypothetical protein